MTSPVPAEPATPAEALDLDAIEADLYEASNVIDHPDAPYNWAALSALRTAEKLLAELRRRDELDAARSTDPGPAPTTWALPAEPPPEVTELWDADGAKWINEDGSWRVEDDDPDMAISWHGALEYGPLSTVPPGTEAGQ